MSIICQLVMKRLFLLPLTIFICMVSLGKTGEKPIAYIVNSSGVFKLYKTVTGFKTSKMLSSESGYWDIKANSISSFTDCEWAEASCAGGGICLYKCYCKKPGWLGMMVWLRSSCSSCGQLPSGGICAPSSEDEELPPPIYTSLH